MSISVGLIAQTVSSRRAITKLTVSCIRSIRTRSSAEPLHRELSSQRSEKQLRMKFADRHMRRKLHTPATGSSKLYTFTWDVVLVCHMAGKYIRTFKHFLTPELNITDQNSRCVLFRDMLRVVGITFGRISARWTHLSLIAKANGMDTMRTNSTKFRSLPTASIVRIKSWIQS